MEYKNEILPIKGMHCSKCVSVIEQILNEIGGVENASVNLAKKQANIKYDPSKVNVDYINEELKSIGYEIGYDFSIIDKIKGMFKKS